MEEGLSSWKYKKGLLDKGVIGMDLLELRGRIDVIDAEIVNLYEQRMEICRQVAEYKISTGKKVLDRQREAEKLEKVKSLCVIA